MTLRKLIVLFVMLLSLGLSPMQPAAALYTPPAPVVYFLETQRYRRRVRRTALRRIGLAV